ncbi:MAG: hypothetical protein HXY21_11705 [Parvularculaceae bacterium]|nr:hypothetical protein [Parvularculaceae bacterium]
MRFKNIVGAALASAVLFGTAAAQSVSGVSGSDVKAGEDVVEYRFAFSPDNDGREESFTHRLHYQHGFDDSLRGRVLVLMGNKGGEALEVQAVSAEALYQFLESEKTNGWDSAIRLDGILSTIDGKPDRVRIGWHNAFELSKALELRSVLLLGKELGDNHRGGLSIETREELTLKIHPKYRVGVQAFNNFNTTAHIGSFDEQRHQVGPIVKGKLTDQVKFELSALFGISDDPTDVDFRFFLSYGF